MWIPADGRGWWFERHRRKKQQDLEAIKRMIGVREKEKSKRFLLRVTQSPYRHLSGAALHNLAKCTWQPWVSEDGDAV